MATEPETTVTLSRREIEVLLVALVGYFGGRTAGLESDPNSAIDMAEEKLRAALEATNGG